LFVDKEVDKKTKVGHSHYELIRWVPDPRNLMWSSHVTAKINAELTDNGTSMVVYEPMVLNFGDLNDSEEMQMESNMHTSDAKQLDCFNAINVYKAKPESEKVRRNLIWFPEGITADTTLVGQQPGSNKNKLETFKKLFFYPINFGGKMRLNVGQHV
jgi:hypothetical protein